MFKPNVGQDEALRIEVNNKPESKLNQKTHAERERERPVKVWTSNPIAEKTSRSALMMRANASSSCRYHDRIWRARTHTHTHMYLIQN